MAIFANNYDDKNKLNTIRADILQPILVLLTEAELFYSAKLLQLNPNDFKATEEFMRKWQYYRGSIDAITDLQSILKGKIK